MDETLVPAKVNACHGLVATPQPSQDPIAKRDTHSIASSLEAVDEALLYQVLYQCVNHGIKRFCVNFSHSPT